MQKKINFKFPSKSGPPDGYRRIEDKPFLAVSSKYSIGSSVINHLYPLLIMI